MTAGPSVIVPDGVSYVGRIVGPSVELVGLSVDELSVDEVSVRLVDELADDEVTESVVDWVKKVEELEMVILVDESVELIVEEVVVSFENRGRRSLSPL